MFQAIPIPEHFKAKQRDLNRDEFIKALIGMEVDTMAEIPDTQYKYNTVRGRVSYANKWLRGTKSGKILRTKRQSGATGTLVMCEAA